MNVIKQEYTELMLRRSLAEIKSLYKHHHRVSDTRGMTKADLVTDIVRARYGNKAVDRAFGIK